jgi:hypothetical protein
MRGPRRSPTLFIALAVASLGAALPSCGDDERPAGPAHGRARRHEAPPPAAAGDAVATKKPESGSGVLSNGRHAVFGLRMPQGMLPTGTPTPGVYRFEGPHPAALVESFVVEQLASFDPVVSEPDAKLYRKALVRKPLGGGAAEPLAIRVHERPDGSIVDVWMEQKTTAPIGAAGAAGGDATSGAPTGGTASSEATRPTAAQGTPLERRRAVFEMLGKVERGEPLTKEDLDNPLFQ